MQHKKLFTFLILFLYSVLGSAQPFNSQFHHHEKELGLSKSKSDLRINKQAVSLTNNYDLRYHRLEWTVDPSKAFINGKITSWFVGSENNFNKLHFEVSKSLSIDSVLIRNQALSFDTANEILSISLKQILQKNQLDSVTVYYHGIPAITGWGSFIVTSHGTNKSPILWTLSEPYGSKDWWPCKQTLTDKIDSVDIIVTTPKEYKVASNGLLTQVVPLGNCNIHFWKHRYPVASYLIGISVTNYEVYADYFYNGKDSLPIINYVFPETLDTAKSYSKKILPVMQLYDSLFGEYPFAKEKYGHAQFGWGGGMEHQTMSFMADFSLDLMAHELAHQWFGNKITCASWKELWLNEGFATYLTCLTIEHLFGKESLKSLLAYKINDVITRPHGSLAVDDTTFLERLFDSHLTYAKGAMMLHMLRWELGDKTFFKAVKNYISDPALSYKYSTTEDFKHHMEIESGHKLDRFFEQWYNGKGYPSYHLSWTQKENNDVSILINQTTSDPSVVFYEMHLPVLLKGEMTDTLIRLNNTMNGQVFIIPVSFKVKQMIFDPELWIISGGNSINQSSFLSVDEESTGEFIILPNPASDYLTLNLIRNKSIRDKILNVQMFSVLGTLVKQFSFNGNQSIIDVSDLKSGVYYLRIYDGTNSHIKKIVVSH